MHRVRFAPSPTGLLHLGNARTAIFNWLFVKKYGGAFVLRIDDTDIERSKKEYTDAIIEDLRWLGITRDEYEEQSKRRHLYDKAIEKLKADGRLYPCYEPPEELQEKKIIQRKQGLPPIYDRTSLLRDDVDKTRAPHWRFFLNDTEEEWDDLIRDNIKYRARNLSDPVLIREDGSIVYTLASVVDDAKMGITDILRGEDHVTNTVVQLQLFRALYGDDFKMPRFGHFSHVLDVDGHGFSKRLGSLSLQDLRRDGALPLAILDVLESLGTGRALTKCESADDIIKRFDVANYGKAPARLDINDIWRANQRILSALSYSDVQKYANGVDEKIWYAIRENISSLNEIAFWYDVCNGRADIEAMPEIVSEVLGYAKYLPEDTTTEDAWDKFTSAIKEDTGKSGKALFLPLRMALTGRPHGPKMRDFFPLMDPAVIRGRLK